MKNLTFILLFINLFAISQNNLSFNRVIDTIIVMDLTTTIGNDPVEGDYFGPEANYTWKLNYAISSGNKGSTYAGLNCSGGCQYCSCVSYVKLAVHDGQNQFVLDKAEIGCSVYPEPNSVINRLDFPIWINSNSSLLQIFIPNVGSGSCDWTIPDIVAQTYLSITEFKITE
jgi:hypothetical protein